MTRPTMDDLRRWLDDESKRMHHNGSLLHAFPFAESYGDDIDDLFWERLDMFIANQLCPWLSEQILDKFGVTLSFSQYGRGGATFAPAEWVYGRNGEYFGIDGDAACNDIDPTWEWEENNLAKYNAMTKLVQILQFINDFWENQASHCEEWWENEVKYIKENE